MWRNSKRSTGLDLPPRTLTLTRLHFTPAEHTFYAHILERTREARDALRLHDQSHAALEGPSPLSPNQTGELATVLLHKRVCTLALRLVLHHAHAHDWPLPAKVPRVGVA